MKNIRFFYLIFFLSFLVVKISIYLDRRVFVMVPYLFAYDYMFSVLTLQITAIFYQIPLSFLMSVLICSMIC